MKLKVIIREQIQIGSGSDITVHYFDEHKSTFDQLTDLVNTDIKWLSGYGKIDDEVYNDEAYVYCKDYVIRYYIRSIT